MNAVRVGKRWQPAAMGPFIGSEALASGALNRYELRTFYQAIMPNIYLDKRVQPSLQDRTVAAWLWSRREGVISGLAASALHGSKWVDDDVPVELIWRNGRSPQGVVTRDELLFGEEVQRLNGLNATTPERTAFDLGRRDRIGRAVERLDALARATDFKVPAVEELASKHRHARGLRQLEKALDLVDAGAESPKETWLRLLMIRAGYPRPRTQIPVVSPDGRRRYYLDMGWEDLKLAVEYEGDHHRVDRDRFAYEIRRLEDIAELGWLDIRVAARHHPSEVLRRVESAWNAQTR
jgi:very-short-patch-repair endonuclease